LVKNASLLFFGTLALLYTKATLWIYYDELFKVLLLDLTILSKLLSHLHIFPAAPIVIYYPDPSINLIPLTSLSNCALAL